MVSVGLGQTGGILDTLKDIIVKPIVNAFTEWIIMPIIYIVGAILYGLQTGLFYVIDTIQMVVRKIVGLPAYSINGERTYGYIVNGEERNDDLVMSFLESDTVRSVFISVLVAGVFLLFISTVIAVLKSETDEKSNAKGPIFSNAIKSIVYFFMVPVVCYLGIIVANLVLKTLDAATSRDAISFSSQIFCAAAYSSNRIKSDADFAAEVWNSQHIPGSSVISDEAEARSDAGREKLAALVDDAFRRGLSPVTDRGYASSNNRVTVSINTRKSMGFGKEDYYFDQFDVKDYRLVFYYYNVLSYNYLIGYAAGLIILGMLLNLLIGVIRRIFEIVTLFVLSPAVVALMPLDGGDKFKTWKDNFIKRVFAAYGPIIGMNLCFMVLELLQNVTLF